MSDELLYINRGLRHKIDECVDNTSFYIKKGERLEKELDTLRKQLDGWKEQNQALAEQLVMDEDVENELRKQLDELSTATEDFIAYIKQGEKEKAHLQMLVVETYLAEINRIGGMNVQG